MHGCPLSSGRSWVCPSLAPCRCRAQRFVETWCFYAVLLKKWKELRLVAHRVGKFQHSEGWRTPPLAQQPLQTAQPVHQMTGAGDGGPPSVVEAQGGGPSRSRARDWGEDPCSAFDKPRGDAKNPRFSWHTLRHVYAKRNQWETDFLPLLVLTRRQRSTGKNQYW